MGIPCMSAIDPTSSESWVIMIHGAMGIHAPSAKRVQNVLFALGSVVSDQWLVDCKKTMCCRKSMWFWFRPEGLFALTTGQIPTPTGDCSFTAGHGAALPRGHLIHKRLFFLPSVPCPVFQGVDHRVILTQSQTCLCQGAGRFFRYPHKPCLTQLESAQTLSGRACDRPCSALKKELAHNLHKYHGMLD